MADATPEQRYAITHLTANSYLNALRFDTDRYGVVSADGLFAAKVALANIDRGWTVVSTAMGPVAGQGLHFAEGYLEGKIYPAEPGASIGDHPRWRITPPILETGAKEQAALLFGTGVIELFRAYLEVRKLGQIEADNDIPRSETFGVPVQGEPNSR